MTDVKTRLAVLEAQWSTLPLDAPERPEAVNLLRDARAEIERWEAKGDRVRRLALDARGIVSLDKKERALCAIYDLLAGEAHP